jgi:hypothetical protein
MVAELIERKFGIRLGLTAIGAKLARLNLTPQKPLQRAYQRDPEAIERWHRVSYPAIARQAEWKAVRSSSGTSRVFVPMPCMAGPGASRDKPDGREGPIAPHAGGLAAVPEQQAATAAYCCGRLPPDVRRKILSWGHEPNQARSARCATVVSGSANEIHHRPVGCRSRRHLLGGYSRSGASVSGKRTPRRRL